MADLPPRDTWMHGTGGLTRWRPRFDSVSVQRTAPDEVSLIIGDDGVERVIRLTAVDAAHLGGLLTWHAKAAT